MVKHHSLIDSVVVWLEGFSQALDNWEAWLLQVERAYLEGNFERLSELESVGQIIQGELADSHSARAELLQAAVARGVNATNITMLVRRLEPEIPLSSKSQLRNLTQQLRRAQQLSAALWVTGFQTAGYTASLLEILATGKPDRATYTSVERESLEGGQIMDAAA